MAPIKKCYIIIANNHEFHLLLGILSIPETIYKIYS